MFTQRGPASFVPKNKPEGGDLMSWLCAVPLAGVAPGTQYAGDTRLTATKRVCYPGEVAVHLNFRDRECSREYPGDEGHLLWNASGAIKVNGLDSRVDKLRKHVCPDFSFHLFRRLENGTDTFA